MPSAVRGKYPQTMNRNVQRCNLLVEGTVLVQGRKTCRFEHEQLYGSRRSETVLGLPLGQCEKNDSIELEGVLVVES